MNHPRDCSVLVWMEWINLWQPPMGNTRIVCATSADQRCSTFNANSKKTVTYLKQSNEWATLVLLKWAWTSISLFIIPNELQTRTALLQPDNFPFKMCISTFPNQGCNKIILVPQPAAYSVGEETQQIRCSDIVMQPHVSLSQST